MKLLHLTPVEPVKHKIVYADPCWQYSNRNTGGSMESSAEAHYQTMTVEELCEMGTVVQNSFSHNCACFMWTTGPFLLDGSTAHVLDAWGFTPKCIAFVWIKTYADGSPVNGMGFYTRSSIEYVVLGVRGEFKRKDASIMQLFEEPETVRLPRLRHSEKPAEIRNRIVSLLGDIPRIEMFSRHKIPGWTYYGNEVLK